MDRTESRSHTVFVIDEHRRVVEEQAQVSPSDLIKLIPKLRERLGPNVRILVDGAEVKAGALEVPAPSSRVGKVELADPQHQAAAHMMELAHVLSWDSYDRAVRVQGWLLEQAAAQTNMILESNQRLAEQATALQRQHQAALAELDFHQREQKMMEAEAVASRLSRHIIEKAQAETAAHVAATRKTTSTLDDILDGIAVVVGGAATMLAQTQPHKRREDLN